MSRITQQEMARRLGVSRSTVAAALNPASPIRLNKATRARILRAAREWDYRPDRHARIMRGGRSGLVGLLHFGGLLQVAAERAFHAAAALRAAGYEVAPTDLSWSAGALETACASLLDARVEGVVVAGLNDPRAVARLEVFRNAGVPLVALSGNPLPGVPHFRGDARRATAELAAHLLARGHRRLLLLGEAAAQGYAWSAEERRKGFAEALRRRGGRISPAARFPGAGTAPAGLIAAAAPSAGLFDPFEAGARAARRLLRERVRPTAILCANDDLAIGVLAACREAGRAVPEEVAVTGYDDTAAGRFCGVPLTTVRQPNRAMAERAVAVLLSLIAGGKAPGRTELFPCEVLLRASTAA